MNWQQLISHLLNTLSTLLVGYFVFAGNIETNKDDSIDVAYSRVINLESQVDELRNELALQAIKSLSLQTQLAANVNPKTTLHQYLDGLPNPAWIKLVTERDGKVEFRMWMINAAYERAFQISRFRYENNTDFEIWDAQTAERFYKHDLEVWENKRASRYLETFREGNEIVTRWVIKHPVRVPQFDWGIAGVILQDVDLSKDCPITPDERDGLMRNQLGMHKGREQEQVSEMSKEKTI